MAPIGEEEVEGGGDADCPGSAASMHAKCKMTVRFTDTDCESVVMEALARMRGEEQYVDPHNAGTYTVLESDAGHILGQRVTGLAPHYTDRFKLTFEGDQHQCSMTACSESQGPSLLDFSTNYCNMHTLYCTGAEGCPSVRRPNFIYTEEHLECTHAGVLEANAHECVPHAGGSNLTPLPPPSMQLAPPLLAPTGALSPPPPHPTPTSSAPLGATPPSLLGAPQPHAPPPPAHRASDTALGAPSPAPAPTDEAYPLYVTIGAVALLALLLGVAFSILFGRRRRAASRSPGASPSASSVSTGASPSTMSASGEFNMELNDAARAAMASTGSADSRA